MSEIILNRVEKQANTLLYDFSVSHELAPYFSGKPFMIEYPENIEEVPDAIANIPFVCNVLPIVWLTDSELILTELDQSFYDCIPNVRKGYEEMYPESVFAGKITVKQITACEKKATGKAAVFFSGGLDSVDTFIAHVDEQLDLISIWGSDIRFDNTKGWNLVHSGIEAYAQKYQLNDVVIRSCFREFDSEHALGEKFSARLKDGWWHGVKHGIGLLGHAAPYAYLKGLSTVYIASSNCPADGPVRCASSPNIDNHVRFANCAVVHDGYAFSRQDKVANVVNYCRSKDDRLSLHVCWESQSGGNCCKCEKCYRTMAGLLAEGADPREYGFKHTRRTVGKMQKRLVNEGALTKFIAQSQWYHIQQRVIRNKEMLMRSPYWHAIAWIETTDFMNFEPSKKPLNYQIRQYLSQFKFYQFLYRVKKFIKKY